jgi:hypothetical protein
VAPQAARASLAAAVAESSMLAGRIEIFDPQQPETAQASHMLALQAAQDAADPLLGSAGLAHMAFIPAFSRTPGRAEEAREKIRAARTFARRGRPDATSDFAAMRYVVTTQGLMGGVRVTTSTNLSLERPSTGRQPRAMAAA